MKYETWNKEKIKNYVENMGYIIISENYKRKTDDLNIIDTFGYKYKVNFNNFTKHSVWLANTSNPFSIENLHLWLKINNKEFILISNEYKGNKIKLEWKCLKYDEIFLSTWHDIQSGYGCPYCVNQKVCLGNSLFTQNPKRAKFWHPTKNLPLTSGDVTAGSNKIVWWKCNMGEDHEWEEPIVDMTGCPFCAKFSGRPSKNRNLLVNNPFLCEEWDYEKNEFGPEKYMPQSKYCVFWICRECNYHWSAQISNRNNGKGCPLCGLSIRESKIATFMKRYCLDYFGKENVVPEYKIFRNPKTNFYLPYDIFLIQKNIFIEINGDQHYRKSYGFFSDEDFEYRQYKDNLKKDYAVSCGNFLEMDLRKIKTNEQAINCLELFINNLDNFAISNQINQIC